jgi:uncharacterized glyoxalase superfamily protein PhnB
MEATTKTTANLTQAVPFFGVRDMQKSLRFYQDGIGFTMRWQWIDEGTLRWCWLERGGASLMLQEFLKERVPQEPFGVGMNICFQCEDAIALYHELKSRGMEPKRPFVGNHYWVTSLVDPDGYELFFESPTDAPEESEYRE